MRLCGSWTLRQAATQFPSQPTIVLASVDPGTNEGVMDSRVMRAVIKDFDSGGSVCPSEFQPEVPEALYIWITLHIGVAEEPGADLFQVLIASHEALVTRGGCLDRYTVVVGRYDWV